MACLVSGRRTSKTAGLLSIASCTVVTHIRNIIQKIECNSQEGIIYFIEKHQKLSLLKHYYANLTSDAAFEKSLKECFTLKKETLPCLIVYYKDPAHRNVLARFLKTHLKLTGIEAEICLKANPKMEASVSQTETCAKTTVFLLEKTQSKAIPQKFTAFNLVDISKQANYYFAVFEILKKFLPKAAFNLKFFEFKKVYDTMRQLHELPSNPLQVDDLNLDQRTLLTLYASFFKEEACEKNKPVLLLLSKKKAFYLIFSLLAICFMSMGLLSGLLIFYPFMRP